MKRTLTVLLPALMLTIAFSMGPVWAFGDGTCPVCAQDGEDPLGWIDDHTTYLDGKLKFSGSIRFRYESRRDWDFNEGIQHRGRLDDGFLLSRARLRADWDAHDYVTFVAEIQDAHSIEMDHNNARLVRKGAGAFQDRLDVFQAYVDIHDLDNIPKLSIRAGRYTLAYGQQRLVGAFQWSNVARSFQGARIAWTEEDWWIHGFYNDVVVPFDDHANGGAANNNLSGIYAQYHGFDWGLIEAYWLRHEQDDIGGNRLLDGRKTHTFGTRIEAKLLENKALDLDGEFVYQDGKFTSRLDHQAWAIHLGGGYTFKDMAWTPRLGAQYNYASGDDNPNDGENNTFDNLFPTNHLHYGSMDRFSWRNLHNLELNVKAKPCKPLMLKLAYHAFWLDEPTSDSMFHAGGGVVRGPMAGADSFVGHEVDLTAKWTFYKHLALMGGYSHFFAEDFLDDTGTNDDANWIFTQLVYKF